MKKILIVEDEEDVLELVRYNLTKEGYLTDTAVTGREARKSRNLAFPIWCCWI